MTMATFRKYETTQGNRWRVRGYLGVDNVTGKQTTLNKRGFKTKKEAQLYFNRAKLDFENSAYDKKSHSITYKAVYEEWMEQYKNTVKESTAAKTVSYFELHILPVFGDLKIHKITSGFLQKQLNQWHKQFAIYKKVFNYCCKIFQFGISQGYLSTNPKNKIIMPTNKVDYGNKKKSKGFYTKDELKSLIACLEGRESKKWLTVFRLLAFTGVRRGELLALTWQDINLEASTLTVNKTLALGHQNKLLIQEPKTESSNRTISIDNRTLTVLKQWKREQAQLLIGFGFNAMSKDQLVFSQVETNTHLNLSSLRNALARICKSHDLSMINIHGFRHTHCSLLFDSGVPMKDVKERLGHADIQTTMNIYTHVTQDSRDESAEKFAKYVNF